MPTWEVAARFWADFAKLTPENRLLFLNARDQFVEDLRNSGHPRPSLRVKRFRSVRGVWELSWAENGRAMFEYGAPRVGTEPHIIWLRIGTHELFRQA